MAKLIKKDKPIRRRVVVRLGIWRIPERDCITPRLQRPETTEPVRAIGFRADLSGEKEE